MVLLGNILVMLPLSAVLSEMLLRIWPRRRHQELVLDLGERKGWTEADRDDALDRLAGWSIGELGLPELLPPRLDLDGVAPPGLPAVALDRVKPVGGVGLQVVALAALAGTAPKTLANSLGSGLRSDRRDHRWLGFLTRLSAGQPSEDAWIYHRRSPTTVSEELSLRAHAPFFDAGDALLVLSIVALWQRRRRPGDARASRGLLVTRRVSRTATRAR